MSEQIVEFLIQDRHIEYKSRADVFAINPKRKAVWLQRLCIWTLRKLRCEWQEPISIYKRTSVKPTDALHKIMTQRKHLQGFLNMEPEELLVGAEDWEEIIGSEAGVRGFNFNAQYSASRSNRYGESYTQYLGLRVRVIPWMRGILVMPKER